MFIMELIKKHIPIILVIILFFSKDAKANAIIPYMTVPLGQAFLLPLIIAIEAFFLKKMFVENTVSMGMKSVPLLGK